MQEEHDYLEVRKYHVEYCKNPDYCIIHFNMVIPRFSFGDMLGKYNINQNIQNYIDKIDWFEKGVVEMKNYKPHEINILKGRLYNFDEIIPFVIYYLGEYFQINFEQHETVKIQ